MQIGKVTIDLKASVTGDLMALFDIYDVKTSVSTHEHLVIIQLGHWIVYDIRYRWSNNAYLVGSFFYF